MSSSPVSRTHRVARNVLSMLATQILTWALATVTMVFLPRYVGDVVLGRMTLAASFAGFAFLFVNLGTGMVLVRDVAQDRSQAGRYVGAILFQRLVLGIIAAAIVSILVHFLSYPAQTKTFICLSTALGIVGAMSTGAAEVLRGQENIPRANIASLVEKAGGALLVIAAIAARLPFWTLIACGGIASLLGLVINVTAFRGQVPRPSRDFVALNVALIRGGMPFFTNAVFMTIYSQCNPIILERISGDAALGWYGLVMRLFGTCLFIPTIVTGAMLPAMVRLRGEKPHAFGETARRMIGFNLVCAAPIATVIIFMPARLIRMLHYPASFLHAVPVFVLFGIGLMLWFLTISVGTVLTAMDRQQEFGRASARAALAAVPLSVACIWLSQRGLHNGAVGAAAAHILIEVYMLSRYLRALPRGLAPADFLYASALRPLLAALPMGLLVAHAPGRAAPAAIAAGLVLYLALSCLLRSVTRQDLALLQAVLSRRGGASRDEVKAAA